ncbi:alcohol dehydrogenase catalytic domain-containing protein [Tessaracoccus coleopterorum]|uniref:alcohol dehydrogenase catalytic domain-containing protein n=1 Tax=Tessaracoccus coleopterorum TaxID=2714950 RepID=UPI001E324A9E|nr:alcohol dehydrogenase catalytic domain-containing protein [Tessaracoccus coleopterorum]
MLIRGAVLEEIGRERPYAASVPIRVQELELAGPGPGEILVRIEAAGICHSDLSVVDGNRVRPVPMLLGHESAGIVEELGEGVDDVSVGDRVAMCFLPRCEECDNCRQDGRLPCTPGSAANNAGTLMGAGSCSTGTDRTAGRRSGTTSASPASRPGWSSTGPPRCRSATTCPPTSRRCSGVPC